LKIEIEIHERLIAELAQTCKPEKIGVQDKIIQLIEEWVMVCKDYEKAN